MDKFKEFYRTQNDKKKLLLDSMFPHSIFFTTKTMNKDEITKY